MVFGPVSNLSIVPPQKPKKVAIVKRTGLVSWRLSGDIFNALAICKRHNAGALQLDFGGNHRGPLLSSYDPERIKAEALQNEVRLSAIALNLYNDLGINISSFFCKQIFINAKKLAENLSISTIFIPSFRLSSINSEIDLINTAAFLRWCCGIAGPDITVASENTLTVDESKTLCLLVNVINFKLIFDPANLHQNKIDAAVYFINLLANIHPDIHIKSTVDSDLSNLESDFSFAINNIALTPTNILTRFNFISENDYRTKSDSYIMSDLEWIKITFGC